MTQLTHGRRLRLIGTSGVACSGEPCWSLRRSGSKNTRERTTEGSLPRPVTSLNVLSASGTAGPERDSSPHESLSEKSLNLIMNSQHRLRRTALHMLHICYTYAIISVTEEGPPP